MEDEYEMCLMMDERCQIREMGRFIHRLEQEIDLSCGYDEQVLFTADGTIHIYGLNSEQIIGVLRMVWSSEYRDDIKVDYVLSDDAEWYPNDSEHPLAWVMDGDGQPAKDGGNTDDQIADRLKTALIGLE